MCVRERERERRDQRWKAWEGRRWKKVKKDEETDTEKEENCEQTNDTETRVTKLRNFWACLPHLFQRLFQKKNLVLFHFVNGNIIRTYVMLKIEIVINYF